jgi:arylsulfatase
VLATQGGRFNGWGLHLLQGKRVFRSDVVGAHRYTVAGPGKPSPGKHTTLVDFKYDGPGPGKGGTAVLKLGGRKVAEGKLERTIPFRSSTDETPGISEAAGTPVSEDDHVPFNFTGTLLGVAIKLGGDNFISEDQKAIHDTEAQVGRSR